MPTEVKIIDGKKQCSICGRMKFLKDFHKSSTKSGYYSQCKECRKNQYLINQETNLKKTRDYYLKNKKRINERKRDWYKKNQIRIKGHMKKYIEKVRLKVLTHYGGTPPKCACCGENGIKFLSMDHISNNGNKHRRELNIRGGRAFYIWLKRNGFPEGYQVLCFNCNFAKAHNNGTCPHKEGSKT